ncbi:MAG: radical SAM protein [Acidobacteria bacterium]|nr:radical SAM protein [Acidobacteriota bacterium]
MAQDYARLYLARAALGAPRDLVNTCIARFRPILPTVAIVHVTFVCDARCEMCNNWKRGDRKTDMTLEQIERVFGSRFWRHIENANISGGEPTTRNDLVDICRVLLDKIPRLRKLGMNTTGLTPHRAIPMLIRIVEMANARGVIFSVRVSIDGVGEVHDGVRRVERGFEKAGETIRAMQELQRTRRFNFGISTAVFARNLHDADNILAWARQENLDIVFNMIRFTEPMLGNADLRGACQPVGPDEERMRQFFLERVRLDPLFDGQNYIYMHYADMIANGYHRLAPCPFQTQGVMLNPDGGLFYCENSDQVGNVLDEDPAAIYFRAASLAHRNRIIREVCPGCLSPCQMNVSAIKQVVPYAKFLVRAHREKRKAGRPAKAG